MPHLEYLLQSTDPLNARDSIDACVLALKQKQNDLVRQWLGEPGKLACTEEMGDAIKNYDNELALAVYIRAQAPHKVIRSYAETGQFDKIVHHSQKIGYQLEDYLFLLESMLTEETCEQGVKLAKKLVSIREQSSGKHVVAIQPVVDIFVKAGLRKECVDFLLDTLTTNDKAEGALQTHLFELYFESDPVAAKALLDKKLYTYYDRRVIAQLCERHGYLRKAVELSPSVADVCRLLSSYEAVTVIESDDRWFSSYLSSLTAISDAIQCLESLLMTDGVDNKNRCAVAELLAQLYRTKFKQPEVVDAVHSLKLDREILQYCENRGWHAERLRYLLHIKNANLWASCLTSGVSTQQSFIDEATGAVTGPNADPDALACLVKAMLTANLSSDLVTLLEKVLLEANYKNRSLSNLMLLTAIKLTATSDNKNNGRVMEYALRLDDYDGSTIADMAESHDLFEEAFVIYKKIGDNKAAIKILIDKIGDLERAELFAKQCGDAQVSALLPKKEEVKVPSPIIPKVEPIIEKRQDTIVERRQQTPPPVRHSSGSAKTLMGEPSASSKTSVIMTNEHDQPRHDTKSPPDIPLKSSVKKLPPLANKTSNKQAFQFAELASKVKIKTNARQVLLMNSDNIQKWLIEIGLGQYADRFARYNGHMLDNLYSMHFSSPEFFCQTLSGKLDGELDNIVIFFGALVQLYGDHL